MTSKLRIYSIDSISGLREAGVFMKNLLAKVKLSGYYPYKIPNSNMTIVSPDKVEVDTISCSFSTSPEFLRVAVPVDNMFLTALNRGRYIDYFYLNDNGRHILYRILAPFRRTYISDDIIHIAMGRGMVSATCNLILIRKSDLSVIAIKKYVRKDEIPVYVLSDKSRTGLRKVGSFN